MDDVRPPNPPTDDKDWTWSADRRCPECGFDASRVEAGDVGDLLRRAGATWLAVLRWPESKLRQRPTPTVWSPLEYACHVSDVLEVYRQRLDLMLTEDGPHYPNWDQDQAAREARYDLADASATVSELARRCEDLAAAFDSVDDHDWARTGFRSDGAEFTIESFARYFLHDPVHHLHDVGVDFGRSS